ncbi:MAG: hypothetical protein JSR76_04630 [Verrucomicrobia bacterium]|nr:hypothetical protein [Verrucomicrobiota bacterium]
MTMLVKLARILGCPIEEHLPISSYVFDSRSVQKGSLFFALKGAKVDGHDFLQEVKERGAYAAVVSKRYQGPDYGLILLYVEDPLEALQRLAREILKERKTRIIGVTGSVGKTTTKEFIAKILEAKYKIGKNPLSYNSQVTLPMVILNAKGNEDFLVLEMSMTEKGHLKKLVSIAPPEIVVITPIVLCHASRFEGVEDIAAAKAEIFTSKCQFAVIHTKSAHLQAIQEACTSENMLYPYDNPEIASPFRETHLTENFMGAVEVALHLGLTQEQIRVQARLLKPMQHRFEKKMIRNITVIDDSYNANPTSVFAALMNLPKPAKQGKTIAILGSMADLGKFSYLSHQQVGEEALKRVDQLYCIGEECRPMVDLFTKAGKSVEIFSDYNLLKKVARDSAEAGDVVLVKGSNFHKLWEVVDFIGEPVG